YGAYTRSYSELLIALGLTYKQAHDLLESCDGMLTEVGKLSPERLMSFGLSKRNATVLLAAVEIGRRRQSEAIPNRTKITSSHESYMAIQPTIEDLEVEEFWVMFLNRRNSIIKMEMIHRGGITASY